MLDENTFASEYRLSSHHEKLTMELEAACKFLSRKEPKPSERSKEDEGSHTIASKALKQVKDQAKVSNSELQRHISKQLETVRTLERISTEKTTRQLDRKSCMDASLPGGAVGELIQEIQRQTQLLDGEPRDLPHQMILVRTLTSF